MELDNQVRSELSRYARRLARRGLVAGAGGNVSARSGHAIWISASGVSLENLRPEELVMVEIRTGKVLAGRGRPSTELGSHLKMYREREDVAAVFHIHPPYSTGLATAGVEFWSFTFEGVLDLGGVVLLPRLMPGSSELMEKVARSAEAHEVLLLPHHGALVAGRSMRQAYYRCCVLEEIALSFFVARMANPASGNLPPEVIREVRRKYQDSHRRRVLEGEGE